jgi:hypothetical protein
VQSREKEPKPSARLGGFVVLVTLLTIVGLTIADFANDGKVSQGWIGALVVICLTFGGYGADRLRDIFR